MHDGVVFRHGANEFLLTAARPAMSWFEELGSRMRVQLEDVTDDYGMLAVQGPRSRAVLASLIPEAETLELLRPRAGQGGRRGGDAVAAPATPATSASS